MFTRPAKLADSLGADSGNAAGVAAWHGRLEHRNIVSGLRIALASLALLSVSFVANAQNLIANPGFENNPPAGFGNNIGHPINPWVLGTGSTSNVVKVDGPGGYNYGNGGPQSDASNGGAGAGAGVQQHYLDIANGANDFYQAFQVPVCGAAPPRTRRVSFSGWFSTRDNLSGSGSIRIRSGTGLGGAILATVSVSLPAPPSSATAPWVLASGAVNVPAGSTISYVVAMDNNLNFDEASLSFFSGSTCATAPLTLQKRWQNAVVNDRAVLTAQRNGVEVDSLTSIANSASEIDIDGTPLTVFQDESIVLVESLPAGNVGTYASTLACTGGGSLSGNVLLVDTTGTPITCTWTNAGLVAELSITKSNSTGTLVAGGTTSYAIVVRNIGAVAANNAVVRDPVTPGMVCTSNPTCSATGGSSCPTSLAIASLQGAGLVIPSLPSGGAATFNLTCTVTATGFP